MSSRHHGGRKRLRLVVLMILVASGCGSRASHQAVVKAWEAGSASGELASPALEPSASGGVPAIPESVVDAGAANTATTLPEGGAAIGHSTGVGQGGAVVGNGGGSNGVVSALPDNKGAAASSSSGAGPGADHGPSAAPNSSGPSPAAAPAIEVVIGNVSTLSGPVGGTLSGGPRAVQAWVAAVNAKGGVNGHRIKLVMGDDGADPARHKALVQQFVEGSNAIAFVHMEAPLSGQSAVAYLQDKKVPVLGTEGGNNWVNENSMYFPQDPSGSALAAVFARATAQVALGEGKRKVAVWVCEFANCTVAVNPDEFRKAGMDVVREGRDSITQPDYTAECLATRNAGADVMFVMMTPDGMRRLTESCKSIGFRPLYGQVGQGMSDTFLRDPELEGSVYGQSVAPFFDTTNPQIAEFRSVMTSYAPGVPVDGSAMTGWVSAKLFEKVLGMSHAPNPTSADILRGLWSIRNDDLGGLTAPLTFDQGAPNNAVHAKVCWWAVRIHAGQWVTTDGGRRQCLS